LVSIPQARKTPETRHVSKHRWAVAPTHLLLAFEIVISVPIISVFVMIPTTSVTTAIQENLVVCEDSNEKRKKSASGNARGIRDSGR